ncbi:MULTISPECIES: acylneuraminate cytidylyltransferase family protein [unclassified Moorena]|uniref:acylneuraminate cytidylyltransferase family protein n=1 Tax=unclassified Moorena TaxID=2683338 RepID=UPI0013C68E4F|nr:MULTISPECIES: acylneuraminate cytidylyltransferase family protein [unclassified Moorena]NEO12185.1 acylneuraminate cytidylyltransferase family protein [Moorena sp. SIO3E8]NEO25310.1 acylneuraminate cytidylyltransferase family protein [Moorena sp. SIO4A5]NEQ00901.1 acylneuraminate cytidylyltransferase family protein [Moorena sp. SIO3F7]
MNKIIGLITARGGSKSIPRKNTTWLAGKPLIAWTIKAALKSHRLNRVIVSTEDEEIAEISKKWGAEVPFLRPAALAQDDSSHISVLIHAVDWLEQVEGTTIDYLMLLQPTSPLRSAQDIDLGIELALEQNADSVVSVCKASTHPYFTRRITSDGKLQDFVQKPDGYLRRQVLPPAYAWNGAIFLVRRDILIEKQTLETDRTYAYVMTPERSLEIDTPWDLYLANLILSDRTKHGFEGRSYPATLPVGYVNNAPY